MKVLFIGDIVGKPGRITVNNILPEIKKEYNPDIVIANAENLSHGRGITPEKIDEMHQAGIDFFTGGDHIFWNRDTEDFIDNLKVIRPVNYPIGTFGKTHEIIQASNGKRLLVLNALGRTFINERLDDPFRGTLDLLNSIDTSLYDYSFVDFHADATSEKHAFAFYLDGKVNAVVGTHTHVPTCDCRVLPLGTAYVTDVGMTGNIDSVLGVKTEIILNLYLTAQNQRFEWESTGNTAFRSVIIDMQNKSIERIDRFVE